MDHTIPYRLYDIIQSRLASSRASLPNYSQIFDSAILEKAEDEGNGNKRVFYPSKSLSKYKLYNMINYIKFITLITLY